MVPARPRKLPDADREILSSNGFVDYRNKVFRLYEERRYRDALDLAREAREKFPEYIAKTSFWIACFQSRLGLTGEAVETLHGALTQGIWWAVETLRDPDLDPVRNTREFKTIEADCARLKREQSGRGRPYLLVRTPQRLHDSKDQPPALMVFHQRYGERPELSAEPWSPILSNETLLAAPWSSQVYAYDGRCWDDPEIAETDAKWALSKLRSGHRFDADRLVLGGFSQGGALAIYCALKRTIPSRGFVAVAPSDWVVPERSAPERTRPSEAFMRFVESSDCRGLRGVIVIGDRDAFFPKIERLYRLMLDKGLDGKLLVEPGLGHEYPVGFGTKLNTAVDFVLKAPEARIDVKPDARSIG